MVGELRALAVAVAAALAATAAAVAPPAAAQGLPDAERPVLLQADEVVYDEAAGVVTARGAVEVAQGERILRADTLSYRLDSDVVTAEGNVSLLEPDGEVIFAERVELTSDLREGVVRAIRVLLTDRSRLAAASGRRTGGDRTEFRRAVFSPCELCEDDPSRAPLWQLKAVQVIHDQEADVIQYRDAWLEMFGVPVLYTPFFQHPDPTVERQSGLLAPRFRSSQDTLGFAAQVPYYWSISESEDATFAPIVATKRKPVLVGEYRRRFAKGRIDLRGSGSIQDREVAGGGVEDDVVRGHVDAGGRFDIDDTWRWGFDLKRASDDTYLRLYDFRHQDERTLTSNAFVEGLSGRGYAAANAYSFQGLRRGDPAGEQPIVAPEVDYDFVGEPGVAGGIYFGHANLLNLNRLEGRDSRRISLEGGWRLPYTTPWGLQTTLTASLRADGYWTDGVDPASQAFDPPPAQALGNDVTGRIFPQAAFRARYPFARPSPGFTQVVEPVAQVVAGPDAGNPSEIPNEDSRDFEFDDTNFLSRNRFPGYDRVDTGQRVDYGLRYSVEGAEGGFGELFLGQSYRIDGGDAFARDSGVAEGLSDVVGRIRIEPRTHLDLSYRFRLDDDESLSAKRHEVNLRAGPRRLNVRLNYSFFDSTAGFADREELVGRVNTQINRYWSAFAAHRRDLQAGDPLSTQVGLTYQDECFLISVVGRRDFFRDREIEKEDSVLLRVVFKHLGEFGR